MPVFGRLFSKRSKSVYTDRPEIEILRKSPFLDPVWYRNAYSDLRDAPIDAARHYFECGAREGRNPSRLFDTSFYLSEYPDVANSGVNPLIHYILHGAAEGRKPVGETVVTAVSTSLHRETGSDTRVEADTRSEPIETPASVAPLEEAREQPRDSADEVMRGVADQFDANFYLDTYPDVAGARIDPLQHYCASGWKEGRDPAHWFSTTFYLRANRDVAASKINPFWHYISAGRAEGRQPSEKINPRIQLLEKISPPTKAKIDKTVAASDRIAESTLFDILNPSIRNAEGLVISFSHTPYTEETAGTELFIGDEQHLFNARGFVYLHLSPLAWSRFMIDTPAEETVNWIIINGKKVGAATISEIANVLTTAGCTRAPNRIIVIHSPLGQSKAGFFRILEAVNPTATYYWLHDFSSLCTGYNLLRNNVAFCSGPPQNSIACTVCVFGASRPEHTALVRQTFEAANFVVVAPSEVARDIWSRASTLPYRSIIVKEHCRVDYSAGAGREARSAKLIGTNGQPIRVVFVGFGAMHKGWPTFERLVDETRGDPAYEFFQFVKKGIATRSRRIHVVDAVVTAADRDAMADLLAHYKIDIVVAPAIWPETFSYVTFEALAAGCDVFTIADSGNIAAQIKRTGRGWVFETEEELISFFTSHRTVDFVRYRAEKPNPQGRLRHIGTTAAIVFAGDR